MVQYQSKVEQVEAQQVETDVSAAWRWAQDNGASGWTQPEMYVVELPDRSGQPLETGQWVVKKADGTFEVLSDDDFQAKYQTVT